MVNRSIESYFAKAYSILPQIITYVAVGSLFLDDLISEVWDIPHKVQVPTRLSLIAAALVGLVLIISRYREDLKNLSEKLDLDRGLEELIPSSQFLDLEKIIDSSKQIRILTLAGTKMARLGETSILKKLVSNNAASVEILLANPRSRAIQERYQHDEPQNYETGLDGLERRLLLLHDLVSGLPEINQTRLFIGVYDAYPTCSIVQGDKDLYSIIYGYKLRGSDCPKIHTKVGEQYSDFLINHFNNLSANSTPLADWVKTIRTD